MTLKIAYESDERELEDDDGSIGMDDASYHIESIAEKEIPIASINAYNHMAIYLRWWPIITWQFICVGVWNMI